eukprot:g1680.t1
MSEFEDKIEETFDDGMSSSRSFAERGVSASANSTGKHFRRASTNPHEMAVHQASSMKKKEQRELDKAALSDASLLSIPESGNASTESQVESRKIRVNMDYLQVEKKPKFVNNAISTSKYNIITFLPIFLFEMFSRVAYLYFLAQAALSFWDEISPFSPIGATLALLFVLFVSGVKAIAEDIKRHNQDNITNNTDAVVINPQTGEPKIVKWREINVGDIVKVKDDELFPADILCLHTGLKDKVCFIRTTNLDGESNLKIRKPVDIKSAILGNQDRGVVEQIEEGEEEDPDSSALNENFQFREKVLLECEVPNGNLHKFRGRLDVYGEDSRVHIPITMSEMLLRGTLLKNSGYVYGLAVYTGPETRIQMNAAKVPLKVGSFDRFLNIQIAILISVQAILCVLLAMASYMWRESVGKDRYYLALDQYVQGNYDNGAIYVALNFITFWILTSYMVPISLFVTMEIVKFWQAFVFVNNDQSMTDPEDPSEHAHARNSNLNEDLGKVEYIFSDKTGTLTSNEMQLRKVNIKGITYGDNNFKVENCIESNRGFDALHNFDERMSTSVDLLKKKSYWNDLVECGGSREYILSMPVSDPSLQRLDTSDREHLQAELNEFRRIGLRAVRSSLSSISGDTRLIRTMSSLNDKGEQIDVDNDCISEYVFGWHMVDFWTNICLCHSLIIEQRVGEDGVVEHVYQGPSPDEVALVEAGRNLGFEFKERTKDGISLKMFGHEVTFDILNVLEFSSDRKRMSIIARASDGTLRLFCKGADNVMMSRLKDDIDMDLKQKTEQALHDFSVQGLRTLVLGTRLLTPEAYEEWDARYQEAARSLADDREKRVDEIAAELEKDFELVGLTAIEDKLQDGVPYAIETLRLAGMKVWMITGDKMETAINIGISCNLITSQEGVLTLSADNKSEAIANLQDIKARVDELMSANRRVELVVDGPSLIHILGNDLETQLAEIGASCSGVVICRSSPSQKAAIVKIMMQHEQRLVLEKSFFGFKAPWLVKRWRAENRRIQSKALSIGDGANDVAMIQAADVGIGIAGKEGRQAVNNSDYALIQFRHLTRLLLVHGQLSHYRLARLIKFSFFKNMAFASILILYQFYSGYSGQSLIDDISAAMFNVVFTSMPILLFSVLDRPMDPNTMMRFPQMYNHSDSLSAGVFWKTGVLQGFIDGAICFFVPYYAITPSGPEAVDGLWAVGKTIFVAILGAVTLEACLVARYWTSTYALFVFLSYFLVFPFFILFPYIERGFDIYDSRQYGIAEDVFSTAIFWLVIFGVYSITFGHRYFIRTTKWLFRPDDNMILAEYEFLGREKGLHDLSEEESRRLDALGVVGSTGGRVSDRTHDETQDP